MRINIMADRKCDWAKYVVFWRMVEEEIDEMWREQKNKCSKGLLERILLGTDVNWISDLWFACKYMITYCLLLRNEYLCWTESC